MCTACPCKPILSTCCSAVHILTCYSRNCCAACTVWAVLQVDDRLNGDGVGYPLGISDPALGWVFVGVASLVWILYFIAQKDFGDFEDKDSGVGL